MSGAPLLEEGLGLPDGLGGEAEGAVAFLAPRDGLKDHIGGGALLHRLDLGGDMPQYADLGGDLKLALYLVEPLEYLGEAGHGVVDGVEADERVAAAVAEALKEGGGDAFHIVGGMVGLLSLIHILTKWAGDPTIFTQRKGG